MINQVTAVARRKRLHESLLLVFDDDLMELTLEFVVVRGHIRQHRLRIFYIPFDSIKLRHHFIVCFPVLPEESS